MVVVEVFIWGYGFVGQEEKLPYAFYINDKELLGSLGAHLLQNRGTEVLQLEWEWDGLQSLD